MMKKRILKRMVWIVLSIIGLIAIAVVVLLNQPSFGRLPSGERLVRVQNSPNHRDGVFQNISPTTNLSSDKSKARSLIEFLFVKIKDLRPDKDLPTIKTDLRELKIDEDILVWMGHSSCYMQISGKRILIDPVLVMASPVSYINKAFKGTEVYTPNDIPDIDYLIISHDHWDHLDYNTMLSLKDRTDKIICPLGVAEHFEYWGFDMSRIIEMDWHEKMKLEDGFEITCLPARHFSGRGLSANKSLWASYMLQSPYGNIYICGDTGYDTHFAEISKQFGTIDLAIMENGQYNEDWKDIHLMPDDLAKAIEDLNPNKLMTVHNSKYALGKHPWYEPLINISSVAERDSIHLLTPMIGEPVYLKDSTQVFSKWWENIN